MKRMLCALLSLLLLATSVPYALAEGAGTCKHLDAEWNVESRRYEQSDKVRHRLILVPGDTLHCPDCGKDIAPSEMDPQAIYEAAGEMMAQARALSDQVGLISLYDMTAGEIEAEQRLRTMLAKYDAGAVVFARWVLEESRQEMLAGALEAHTFGADGLCPCGMTLSAAAHLVSGSEKLSLNVGDTLQIALNGATPKGWKAKSSKIVKLSKDGKITALKEGKTTVTITLTNKKKWKLTVTVVDPYKPKGIKLSEKGPLTLRVGDTLRLTPVVSPASAVAALSWKSSKAKVVSVGKDGTLTARKAGTATITVKTQNGKKAKIKVKVKK